MFDEKHYTEIYLQRVQKKIETMHEKNGYEENRVKFEERLAHIHVLQDIETFLWDKL